MTSKVTAPARPLEAGAFLSARVRLVFGTERCRPYSLVMTLDMRSAIVAAIGFVAGAAVISLLPTGMFWATQNADAQVVEVRKLADLPASRVVGPPLVLNVDPKHRGGDRPMFKP